MSAITLTKSRTGHYLTPLRKKKRVESIDIVRGAVMIIMALDHARHWFHHDAYVYEPTDLSRTNIFLFFTRFITHYCAPVFIFLAGISAYLNGVKKTKKELAFYLITRGIWLIFVEFAIISLGNTFNISFPFVTLQVIWAIGICMIVLAGLIYLRRSWILGIALVLIAGHNLLDNFHVNGNGPMAFIWAVLHEPKEFIWGSTTIFVLFPVLPWIGVMALGYYMGTLFRSSVDPEARKKLLLYIGTSAVILFFILRAFNIYGDPSNWTVQDSPSFSFLSILNVTKYPPSLLYNLITIGPAMIILALLDGRPLNSFTRRVAVFGRAPFFYYVVHLYVLHLCAVIGAILADYNWYDMILSTRRDRTPALQGFGFNLFTTYCIWIGVVLFLYPLCKWFDQYKRNNQSTQWWLTYF
jgi:uncharacterized membrane protein